MQEYILKLGIIDMMKEAIIWQKQKPVYSETQKLVLRKFGLNRFDCSKISLSVKRDLYNLILSLICHYIRGMSNE
jgi:hypothetical protein